MLIYPRVWPITKSCGPFQSPGVQGASLAIFPDKGTRQEERHPSLDAIWPWLAIQHNLRDEWNWEQPTVINYPAKTSYIGNSNAVTDE